MTLPALSPRPAIRPATEAFHRLVVERAVLAIRRRFSEENLGLAAIAASAISSPFHFARLFRRIAGVPPGHFLTAVRMAAAKRLLTETSLSVTNVCLEVGYNSIGTFTRRFTELVGVPPRGFRNIARAPRPVPHLLTSRTDGLLPRRGAVVRGELAAPVPARVAVGLFPSAIPQGRPAACCVARAPGPFRIGGVGPGRYFVLAAALDHGGRLSDEPELRGAAPEPIVVESGAAEVRADIVLRSPHMTDPPIVVCIPLLLDETPQRSGQPRPKREAPLAERLNAYGGRAQ